ncbi:MAG: signal peptidase II [Pseudomonadota bacterium]
MIIRWASLIGILIIFDQVSKYMVETMLPLQRDIPLLPFLSLYRTYNEGVAFSAFSNLGPWPLIILTSVIILFILWLWRGLPPGRWISSFGYALVLAGAIGNLIDRVRLGKVIDMIFFHIDQIGFYFAVFNLADTFITLGAVAIIIDEFIQWRNSKQKQDERTNNP